MVSTQVIDIPFVLALRENLKNRERGRASYWRHDNTPLPENTKYSTQYCDDITI